MRASLGAAFILAGFITTAAQAVDRIWDGGAATDSWHDDANWAPDGVPGIGDNAIINSAVNVIHSSGDTLVDSVQVTNGGTLNMNGGTIDTAVSFTVTNSFMNYNGGMLPAEVTIVGSILTTDPAATMPVLFTMNSTSTYAGPIHSGQTVWCRGNSTNGHALLTLDGVTNHGTLLAESLNSSWNSQFRVPSNGTFTNAAGGLIDINLGTGGARSLTGFDDWTFHNFGTIDVVDIDFPMIDGTYRHGNGTITGSFRVESADVAIESTATMPTTLEVNRVCTLLEHESTDVDLWVRGKSGPGDAVLFVGDITNNGIIRLESSNSSWDSRLQVVADATFTNGPGATINIVLGTGGPRWILGAGDWTFRNEGTMNIEPTDFSQIGGTYEHVSGVINGDFILDDVQIAIKNTATTPSTLIAVQNCRLLEHESTDITLWVNGRGGYGDAQLLVGNVTNRGHMRFESTESSWNSDIQVDADATFTNDTVGVIDVNLGTAGPRTILGSGLWGFRNLGTINVETGAFCTTSGTDLLWEQVDGSINADGELRVNNAMFIHSGGAINGDVNVASSTLAIEPTATIPATIATNQSCTLAQHDSPAITVWVRGRNGTGNAFLNVGTMTVHGTIMLESENSTWASRVVVGTDDTLTLADTAVFDVNLGTGGERYLIGTDNWTCHNFGLFDIEEGELFQIFNGTYRHSGGDIIGLGEFVVDDCFVDIDATATEACTIIANQTCTLLGHDAPDINLWVRGQGTYGQAQLFCGDVTNHGIITLESIQSTWRSGINVSFDATFTNGPGGVINVNLGSGGSRDFLGTASWTFRNEGQLNIEPIFCQVSSGRFEMGGGKINGDFYAQSSTIATEATATESSTIIARGNNTLDQHDAVLFTVWVQGNSTTGHATLNVDNLTFNGALRLESINSTWFSNITDVNGGTLTIGDTGRLESKVGSGGARTVNGHLANHGSVNAGYPNFLEVTGDYTQSALGTFVSLFAGETEGTHTRLNVNGNAAIDGAIRIAREGGFVPTPGLSLNVLDVVGELTGMFIDITSCDPINVVSDFDNDEVYVIFGEASDIPGDLTGDEIVNVDDLLILLSQWGACPDGQFDCCPGDLDESGTVDVNDLLLQLANWT